VGDLSLRIAILLDNDGTDHSSRHEQARMMRCYIAWRNRHARDLTLSEIVNKAIVA
jgi:hypothetical protein